MKILCVIDSLGSGGAQRQLVGLANEFKKLGNDVSFLVYHPESFYKEELGRAGIPIHYIKEANYIKRILKMRKFIRATDPAVLLSFLGASNFICEVAGFPSKNWILIVGERSANPNILKSLKLKFYRWFHFFADYIVANSYENINLVKKINPLVDSKCRVIYNMIDFEVWKPSKEYIPFKDGSFHLVVAASHQHLKNSKGLIEAIQLLDESEKARLKVDWYGDRTEPPYFDQSYPEAVKLVKSYRLEGILNFHPATANIVDKIQHADAIGLFSYYEGLPNTICEGLACGKPVIVSNISDIPLLIKNKNLYFDPTDKYSLLNSLKYLLNMNKTELNEEGLRNLEIAQTNFNKISIVKSYINLTLRKN